METNPDDAFAFTLLEGQVTNHIGAGHAGVSVHVFRKADGDTIGEKVAETKTGKFGDFIVKVPEPTRGDFRVRFAAEGYADLERDVRVGDDEFPPYLAEMLPGKYIVVGRVVAATTEQAVTGASVKLSAAYNEWYADTDDEGNFTFKGVLPGRGDLIVEADGFGRERRRVERLEDFGEIIVPLKPHRIIEIDIRDAGGKPIAGATVELLDEPRDDLRTTVTDENGRAIFEGLHFDAAIIALRLTHEDFVGSEQFDREIVTPTDETRSTHRLVMDRAGRIAGRVTAISTGEPLGGARVIAGAADSDNRPRDWTDYRGRFDVHGVRPGPTVVTIHRTGFAPELRTAKVSAGESVKLDVALSDPTILEGIVRNEDGDPVSGVLIETTTWRGHTTLDLRAQSGEDGRFVINDAPRDAFEIAVRSPFRAEALLKQTVAPETNAPIEIQVAAADFEPPAATALVKIGDTAPVIDLTTLRGTKLNLKALRGKTIVLDFWATWCAPCVAELPHLIAAFEKFGNRDDFVMIGISLDGDQDAFRKFVKSHKLGWHQVFGNAGGAQQAADRYGVTGLPSLFVIDPDGKVIGHDWHGKDLVDRIERALNENDRT